MKAGTLLKNYTEVLAILTRLRQLCCHPKLCTAALEAAAKEGSPQLVSFNGYVSLHIVLMLLIDIIVFILNKFHSRLHVYADRFRFEAL